MDVNSTSAMGTCLIEEEICPILQDDIIQLEAQPIDPHPIAYSSPEVPGSCRFSEEHLKLIFELRRDVIDHLHCQTILCSHLDAFFDSLSREPVKRRFPAYSQPYDFFPAWPKPPSGDGNLGSPSV
jgi:hypothetical protein